MQIIVIDNYDSFTYNLVQYLGELGVEPRVFRNDALSADDPMLDEADGGLVSPGPGNPDGAGVSLEFIRRLTGRIPILGVCLGHQCVAQAFGARIERAGRVMHGKTSPIIHDGQKLFAGLANPFEATRYHSLLVAPDSVPATLEVSARTAEGEIMGVRHRRWPVSGVQFHPESILTEDGRRIVENFLAVCDDHRR